MKYILIWFIIFINYGFEDNLRPELTFGSEGVSKFANPLILADDGENSIFVLDQVKASIFEFNYEGKFINSYGRSGRGPGELLVPISLDIDKDLLYVQDRANLRMVKFNVAEKSSTIFNQKSAFIEFKIYDGKIYAYAPPSLLARVNDLNESLIKVFDKNGKMIDSFGEYLKIAEDITAGMSWPYIAIDDDIIHVVFQYFPIYRAYNLDGELLTEVDLSSISEIGKPESNYDDNKYKTRRRSKGGDAVVRAMDVNGARIFTCRQSRSIIIDEFIYKNGSINHFKTYTYKNVPKDYYVKDFIYNKANNAFYVLEKNNIPKVTVYKINE